MSTASEPVGETPPLDPAIQSLLDQARARQRRDIEAQCAHQQAEARLQRAYEAWLKVASYRGDAIPRGLTPAERRRAYAEVIVELGRGMECDGWRERLDSVTPGTDAKTYAVALLRKAMDGDLAAVEVMVREAMGALWQLGLDADSWLRRGLMYEVLGIRPAPEPPPGWEGSYPRLVESVQDFVAWIDHEFLVQHLLGQGRGEQSSDGRRVRNAFRLVSQLELTGLPLEPLGPWKLQDELAVLRNLRRLCLGLVAAADGGDAPDNGPCLNAGHEEETTSADVGRAGKAEGETAEAVVQRCLNDNHTASLQDVTKVTGLSVGKVRRTSAWKDHEERVLDAYLQQHREASTGDVKGAFGLSRSKVVTTNAWKKHRARREAARSRRRVESRERPLTEAMLSCRADEAAVDPGARISHREQIYQTILEYVTANARARLHSLKSAEREQLLDYLLTHVDGEGVEGREAAAPIELLVEVVYSWLDEHEQETRHAGGLRERRHTR
jgi:hypothetical protein